MTIKLTLSVLDVNSSDQFLFLGQHRSLGPGISKVRSMKLDSSIWTNELIEVPICCGSRFLHADFKGIVRLKMINLLIYSYSL